MEEPTSYLDLLEDQAGVMERIERLKRENIAAELLVYIRRPPLSPIKYNAEMVLYSKDLLSNRIKTTLINIEETFSEITNLRNRIIFSTDETEEFKLGDSISISGHAYPDITLVINNLSIQVDRELFLRLLEEYVNIVVEERSTRVTFTTDREVFKTHTRR